MKKFHSTPGASIHKPSLLPPAIKSASTSTAAIIGSFPKGSMTSPQQVRTWEAFEKKYGGLETEALFSLCIKQFFDNEGKAIWVVRIGTRQIKAASPFLEGLSLLNRVGDFNILFIPQTEQLPDTHAIKVMHAAIALVAKHRAMYVLDVPQRDAPRQTVRALTTWLNQQSGIHHPNVAMYVPRVQVHPSLKKAPLHIPASGAMAGVLARTDQQRGVWKAPAGTEAILHGVQGIEQTLTQPEMGQLTQSGINPIRQTSPSQVVAWGARTLSSNREWQYLSVRRLALFLESSIQQGLGWVVDEPNDQTLWAHIRQTIDVFLQSLFRQGAFQGQKAQEAYFVKCGPDTISSADQNAGSVNIMIGFAPLKPAEFIILTIQQKAKSVRQA
ncbi:phage tail sheath family protein [Candidatus Nitrospira allomarina]|uniref:Phage tail sheath C-terminal domain-containing protein n=1 Tax=Candidatus Nitrospira allomarina TaxID=3020900 RepID=A0AA96GBG9_9BACT|nr:phage tail sheath C-terminal domain-containing protein [Candidatus Nitrospira allomarina]WNM57085.1 phage tail sheath C-terminal domain-containing protein [Candidatus Nitrospira allomarina]